MNDAEVHIIDVGFVIPFDGGISSQLSAVMIAM